MFPGQLILAKRNQEALIFCLSYNEGSNHQKKKKRQRLLCSVELLTSCSQFQVPFAGSQGKGGEWGINAIEKRSPSHITGIKSFSQRAGRGKCLCVDRCA